MKITNISVQARNPDRVNVSVDGRYKFSLDILQVTELGVSIGREYSEAELALLEEESSFGKVYTRALEYALVRPRSVREMRDYLWRKTRSSLVRRRTTGEVVERAGISKHIADRVLERLLSKRYVDDVKFAHFWVENRNQRKGTSMKKLRAELYAKGIDGAVIDEVFSATGRSDASELEKIIAKKRTKYPDEQKLVAYLARLGFRYDDITSALQESDEE